MRLVENADPREWLLVKNEVPRRGSPALLFLEGEVASSDVETRSVLDADLGTVRDDDPLMWHMRDGDRRPVGRVDPAERPMLGQLGNAGWGASAPDGAVFFASALRPEVLAFGPEGRLRWRARWEPERPVEQPRFRAEEGSLRVDFSVIQHGVAEGPDGRVYVLAAPTEEGVPDRLLVFDQDGILVREGEVEPRGAILADQHGRVFSVPPSMAVARTPTADRLPFRPFRLPSLDGEGVVDLEAYSGQVVVVNFWASWCPPCRREIPALEELFIELRDEGVVMIGLNEDVDPAAGLRFLEELGGVAYPNAAGRSRLRADYGYRGLPYTVVLDRRHRVVRTLFGFGTSIEPVRSAVHQALDDRHP